jgi:hypothetical protein
MKNLLLSIVATMMSLLLLYIAKDYPCLRGAGLAMADFEAFILSVFVALPCFIWASRRLIVRPKNIEKSYGNSLINYMAIFTIFGAATFLVFAILVIFFTSEFPLRFVCEQPHLAWLFKFPM